MIDIAKPFFLYALCEVEYNGRAVSNVGPGLRVIIRKADGAVIIHSAVKITPMNYIGSGSSIQGIEEGNITNIICRSKSETISIKILSIIQHIEMVEWNSDKITLHKTEAELCDKLIQNAEDLLNIKVSRIQRELVTPNGPIDIVFVDTNNVRHCIEVKRKAIRIPAVYQLYRYMAYLSDAYQCVGYLAGPSISDNALREADKYDYKFIRVTHSI